MMKMKTIKYMGAAFAAGAAVGLCGTAMINTGRARHGIKSARKNATKAVRAMGSLVDNVKYMIS